MIVLKQTGVSSVKFCFAKGGSMPKRPLESLGVIVREKRAHRKLRETAKEIGIGPATWMRVESGRIPDVETFGARELKMNFERGFKSWAERTSQNFRRDFGLQAYSPLKPALLATHLDVR